MSGVWPMAIIYMMGLHVTKLQLCNLADVRAEFWFGSESRGIATDRLNTVQFTIQAGGERSAGSVER
jgi:hypothetical protein